MDPMPDAITRLKTALEKARHDSLIRGVSGQRHDIEREEEAWSAVSAAIEAVEGRLERTEGALREIGALRIRHNTFSAAQIMFDMARDFARNALQETDHAE